MGPAAIAMACGGGGGGGAADGGADAIADVRPGPDAPADAREDAGAPGEGFRFYWILGQRPDQSTVYLYSRTGATVRFGGSIRAPRVVDVPPDTFVSHNIGALGYGALDREWYYLEASGDADFMTHFDRVVAHSTAEDTTEEVHGDLIHDRPPTRLSTSYTMAAAQSGPSDDILVMYAPEPAEVTVRAFANTGAVTERSASFTGLYVSDPLSDWLGLGGGYGLRVEANKPIAAAAFDEVAEYPSCCSGSGYFFAFAGQAELYDEHMHIALTTAESVTYEANYVLGANALSFLREGGGEVTSRTYEGEASTHLRHAELGYGGASAPYLIHTVASAPYATAFATSVETDVRAEAAYMGWNASLATLEIYAREAASVEVYDGRTRALHTTLAVAGGAVHVASLVDVGFAENEPFLAVVAADVPVYQAVVIPYYLRQYPGDMGPILY